MNQVNPDLAKERLAATFNREELTHVWDGGKAKTQRRKYIGQYLYRRRILNGASVDIMCANGL